MMIHEAHVGTPLNVAWSIDHVIQIHARITWEVVFIRAFLLDIFFFNVGLRTNTFNTHTFLQCLTVTPVPRSPCCAASRPPTPNARCNTCSTTGLCCHTHPPPPPLLPPPQRPPQRPPPPLCRPRNTWPAHQVSFYASMIGASAMLLISLA